MVGKDVLAALLWMPSTDISSKDIERELLLAVRHGLDLKRPVLVVTSEVVLQSSEVWIDNPAGVVEFLLGIDLDFLLLKQLLLGEARGGSGAFQNSLVATVE